MVEVIRRLFRVCGVGQCHACPAIVESDVDESLTYLCDCPCHIPARREPHPEDWPQDPSHYDEYGSEPA